MNTKRNEDGKDISSQFGSPRSSSSRTRGGVRCNDVSWANYLLMAVNVLVFVVGLVLDRVLHYDGFLYRRGLLYAPLILKGQGFYRLLTSVFLHADAGHLTNNMIVQFAGGDIVEKNLGHWRFIALYLLSGVAGNIVSVFHDYITGEYGFSIGASGAVFGVIGALLFLILQDVKRRGEVRKDRWEEDAPAPEAPRPYGGGRDAGAAARQLLLRAGVMTAWLLYSGWVNPRINQAAHVGGLFSGFLLAAVLMYRRPKADVGMLLS
ncbi:MAG: rhomboid family intramembrane serine protease [Eubacteriales bacterium]|nr:rhomboid family intramembrane serine protease [Eubacteriales bacterium]